MKRRASNRIHNTVEKIIYQAYCDHYRNSRIATVRHLYYIVHSKIERLNSQIEESGGYKLAIPCERTIYRKVARYRQKENIMKGVLGGTSRKHFALMGRAKKRALLRWS